MEWHGYEADAFTAHCSLDAGVVERSGKPLTQYPAKMELPPVLETMDEFASEPVRTHGTDGEVEMNSRPLTIRTFEEVHRTIIRTGTDRASRAIEPLHP